MSTETALLILLACIQWTLVGTFFVLRSIRNELRKR